MGRHGIREVGPVPSTRSLATPIPGRPTSTTRAARQPAAPARLTSGATGRVLIAAVAAGAVLPAAQALDTHTADAESTTASLNRADLSLASAQQAKRSSSSSVSSVAMPGSSSSSPRHSSSRAGDASDVSSLTKAMTVSRENGPVEFGRPYQAGNDDTLNGQIAQALGLLGLPQKLAPGVKKIIMRESTGNAHAVNGWDSNAAAGTPSKGLMQLIDTTFRNAVLPSLASKGIFDPVANITAGVRTMVANHGLDAVMDGGLRNSSGDYIGYGGAKLPDDGLGLASRS